MSSPPRVHVAPSRPDSTAAARSHRVNELNRVRPRDSQGIRRSPTSTLRQPPRTAPVRLERPLPGHAEYPHNYFSITVAQRGGHAFATTFRAVQSFLMFDVKTPTP